MAQTIITLLLWLIVPIILIATVLFSVRIVRRVREPEAKLSARAGFWAGIILFVIFIVSQLRDVGEPRFDFSTIPDLDLVPVLGGGVIGFVLLWLLRALVPTRWVGVVTLLLTAVSAGALYSFIFIDDFRIAVLYASLGGVLGILVHIVLFPSSIGNLWKRSTKSTAASASTAASNDLMREPLIESSVASDPSLIDEATDTIADE